jgi:hypothetical protein
VDSLFLKVSENGVVIDTFEIGLVKKSDSVQAQKGRSGKGSGEKDLPFKLLMLPNASTVQGFDVYRKLRIRFSHPLSNYDLSKIQLYEKPDSTGKAVKAAVSFSDTAVLRNLIFDYPWKPKMKYELFIPPGSFTDIYGLENDTLKLNFTTTDIESYGILKINLKITDESPQYVFQLLDGSKNTVRELILRKGDKLKFEYLNPGDYKARVIIDRNSNGKWDSGRYLRKIQPEKVYYYPSVINVRANWDTEIDWEL